MYMYIYIHLHTHMAFLEDRATEAAAEKPHSNDTAPACAKPRPRILRTSQGEQQCFLQKSKWSLLLSVRVRILSFVIALTPM